MSSSTPFLCLISYLITARLIELVIAKRNEKWLKQRGAVEFGKDHYRYLVTMHMLFFAVFVFEKIFFNCRLTPLWPAIFLLFILGQMMRVWIIASLGKYWNTKIIVLPNAKVVKNGPYRFMKHPNYCIVTLEFIVIPLLFSTYYTLFIFTLLNMFMLMIRIPEEEKALKRLTEYEGTFHDYNRFIPKIVK